MGERICEYCGGPLPARANQRFCSRACRDADRAEEYDSGAVVKALIADSTERVPQPRATPVYDARGVLIALRCGCGAEFALEYDKLGRRVSRALCPACREDHYHRRGSSGLPPPGTPRCESCGCVLAYAGAASPTLCIPCARWREKAAEREARSARESAPQTQREPILTASGAKAVSEHPRANLPLSAHSPWATWTPQPWPRRAGG